MEELISRYFFIAIVIFATILDLVGRWYKKRQRSDGRPRPPNLQGLRERQERLEREDAREELEPDWRQMPEVDWRAPEPEWRPKPESAARQETQPDFRQKPMPAARQKSLPAWRPPGTPRVPTSEVPDLARILLDELQPPMPWTEIRRSDTSKPAVEQPLVARVVRAPRPAGARSAVQPVRMPTPPRVRRRLRASLEDPAAARRAIVLAEILGPCRGVEPVGRRR